ncbi:hypothetical protein [Streptomyces sudanensis]|uniref:hypothetical protein n=1 Tax=Streptomyces sudanensis TaxID=436397 RepID=UPI0020CFC531|nr:hypothetical protein [Streptomyces sudanensis]MCP9958343.1 hypothetical protein [Streptomyces sudanensis]MCQ0001140.1 hypothetical protein [Streptomyces sudanensis]
MGFLSLTACGTQTASSTSTTSAGSEVSASPTRQPTEKQFLDTLNEFARQCSPDAPSGSSAAPDPGTLPGGIPVGEAPRTDKPAGTPDANGDIPIPVDESGEMPDKPMQPGPPQEVELGEIEKCPAAKHVERITTKAAGQPHITYSALQQTIIAAGYRTDRIHKMPDLSGDPRARVDLRFMGSRLALEVIGSGTGVIVEPFGAPEDESVAVIEVRRKPNLDAPPS